MHRKGHGSTYVKLLVVVKSREQNVRMRDFLFLYELLQRLTFLHYNEFFLTYHCLIIKEQILSVGSFSIKGKYFQEESFLAFPTTT